MGCESAPVTRREPDTGKRLEPRLYEKREAIHSELAEIFEDHNQDDNIRYEQLRKWLDTDEYPLPTRELINCYFDWKASDRVVWPFEGGRLQQPDWILSLWRTLERIDEFYALKKKVIKKVSIAETMP